MVLRKETGLRELALFAGAGGGILGGLLCGWRTVCAVEIEEYPRSVLLQRQLDGILPRFPIWDDVRTFDGKPWRGKVDVISGGFPCQDISSAGKGAGIEGERSGLWKEMARIIGEVRPRYAFVENSPLLVGRGLAVVLGDLAEMGYDVRWCVLGADDVGAPHKRERMWILAHINETRRDGRARQVETETGRGQSADGGGISNTKKIRLQRRDITNSQGQSDIQGVCSEFAGGNSEPVPEWWTTEPPVGRVANGVANRVDRIKSIGNGQVPAVVRLAWEVLTK